MDIESEFVHLAKLAIEGDLTSMEALIRRTFRSLIKNRPDLSDRAKSVIGTIHRSGPIRGTSSLPLPVDLDSRLELLRREVIDHLDVEPVWPDHLAEQLKGVVDERAHVDELFSAGLTPTRSVLFSGPPGVGKTLAARWLACSLSYPLLTLDLAGVISSFLGRTGNNIRTVLDYARRTPSVLLLDEFDAIAKRRDDVAEVGELKRLVTVLLQEVDDWSANGLLIAATNHPDLLDPAVWRRFDRIIEFPLPGPAQLQATARQIVRGEVSESVLKATSLLFSGQSNAELVRAINLVRREAVLTGDAIQTVLLRHLRTRTQELPRVVRWEAAQSLREEGLSQRHISDITGVSRDTMRAKWPASSHDRSEDADA